MTSDPKRRANNSEEYFGWARVVGVFAVITLAIGGAFHGGFDALLIVGWSCALLALVLTIVGAVRRRGEPSPEPMRPYAVYLAAPAALLLAWAEWTDSHNGLVYGFSIVPLVWAFFRSIIELVFGRLYRDWRPWLAFSLCFMSYAIAKSSW
jgi:hypothetical protein